MSKDEIRVDDLPALIEFLLVEVPFSARERLSEGLDEWEQADEPLRKKWNDLLMSQWLAISQLEQEAQRAMKGLEDDDTVTALHAALAAGALYGQLIDGMWQAKQLRPQANLKVITAMVSDADILAVVNDANYDTREKQADKLGISLRYLQKRLQRLKNSDV